MAESAVFLPPAGWVSIFRAAHRRPCEDRALVLGAMQIEHRVIELPDGCHLLVPQAISGAAREQLRMYEVENPPRAAAVWPGAPPARGVPGILTYVAVIGLMFAVQHGYLWGMNWSAAGEVVAGRIRNGEWWRAVTALTLHADGGHVAGNMVFGAFFGYLAGQYLGSGIAWFAVLGAAAAGNVANAWLQLPAHRSLGASTAVFAALGLVAAHIWTISRRFDLSWARRWAPVVGAVALLAYTGTGDERTDIVAHLAGFVAGAVAGAALGVPKPETTSRSSRQLLAGMLCLLLVATSWWRALTALP
jgi:membrane associated rhomboid family serine protease